VPTAVPCKRHCSSNILGPCLHVKDGHQSMHARIKASVLLWMLRSSVNGRVSSRDQIKKWQQVTESIQGTTRVCVVKEKNRPGSDVVGTMCGSNENRRAYDEMHHLASHAPHCMPHCCICYHLSRPDTPKCSLLGSSGYKYSLLDGILDVHRHAICILQLMSRKQG
jgi:hypothetical protein